MNPPHRPNTHETEGMFPHIKPRTGKNLNQPNNDIQRPGSNSTLEKIIGNNILFRTRHKLSITKNEIQSNRNFV